MYKPLSLSMLTANKHDWTRKYKEFMAEFDVYEVIGILGRIEERIQKDIKLKNNIQELKAIINKSQE